MTKKQLRERLERNMALAVLDAKHRCGTCRTRLRKAEGVIEWNSGRRFCSRECLTEDALRQAKR